MAGAGPAGSAAALAALREGASVSLFDRSSFPRHKVCGEFLSAEAMPLLERLGVAAPILAANPPRIRGVSICFGGRERKAELPEAAIGVSRHLLDHTMQQAAVDAGAELTQSDAPMSARPLVLATGRGALGAPVGEKRERLFGFKAHFEGPADDVVGLWFFDGGYAGVNAVEGGRTNVCGLARLEVLERFGHDVDGLLAATPALRERLSGNIRVTEWFSTGPLVFRNRLGETAEEGVYPSGDSLSFVDPFTGSGQTAALLTGALAGRAAARRIRSEVYFDECRKRLRGAFRNATLIREVVLRGWGGRCLPVVPIGLLYYATRAKSLPKTGLSY